MSRPTIKRARHYLAARLPFKSQPTIDSLDLAARFWPKVDKTTTLDGCWPFIGYRDPLGYGWIWFDGHMVAAHRVALALSGFIIPAEFLQVRHYICKNTSCCRPDHLRIGTKHDDAADKAWQHGRPVGPVLNH